MSFFDPLLNGKELSALVKVAYIIPLTLLIILSTPGWIVWIFLNDARRDSAIDMVREMTAFGRPAGKSSTIDPTSVLTRPLAAQDDLEEIVRRAVAEALRQQLPASGLDAKGVDNDPDVDDDPEVIDCPGVDDEPDVDDVGV
ncbi:hypothetical protein V7793_17445 [Streptomyces sp. KLMMK]|uniref:hypothetical protein n=1 Tax=Streptomyces sp. KLMMK TaxID=3109353 RepID=UPI00300A41F0